MALKSTANAIHRRLSQARMAREQLIRGQTTPAAAAARRAAAAAAVGNGASPESMADDCIVPPSPALGAFGTPAATAFTSSLEAADQHLRELSRLRAECNQYKVHMHKAELEAKRARSDLNEVVQELLEVKSRDDGPPTPTPTLTPTPTVVVKGHGGKEGRRAGGSTHGKRRGKSSNNSNA